MFPGHQTGNKANQYGRKPLFSSRMSLTHSDCWVHKSCACANIDISSVGVCQILPALNIALSDEHIRHGLLMQQMRRISLEMERAGPRLLPVVTNLRVCHGHRVRTESGSWNGGDGLLFEGAGRPLAETLEWFPVSMEPNPLRYWSKRWDWKWWRRSWLEKNKLFGQFDWMADWQFSGEHKSGGGVVVEVVPERWTKRGEN